MRIILADENPDVRYALSVRLTQEPGLNVVGEAAAAQELLTLIEATRPDIVLLDWELPGMPIVDVMVSMRDKMNLSVIVLSTHNGSEQNALAIGADAFVCKTNLPEDLIYTLKKYYTAPSRKMKTRILMIETPMFSHYVKNVTRRTSCGMEIIGGAPDVSDALALNQALGPDVIIVDIRDGSNIGIDKLIKTRNEFPGAIIIGRIKKSDKRFILDAVAAGAMGFVSDQTRVAELIEAISTVRQGFYFLPQNLIPQFSHGLQLQNPPLH